MAKFDKTFPTLDCAACILTPKMSAVRAHPNITLWTYSEVSRVEGYVGNFRVTVTRSPRYVKEDLCVGCLECIEACVYKEPRFVDDFNVGLGKRKPIYIPFPQATPQMVLIDREACLNSNRGNVRKPVWRPARIATRLTLLNRKRPKRSRWVPSLSPPDFKPLTRAGSRITDMAPTLMFIHRWRLNVW